MEFAIYRQSSGTQTPPLTVTINTIEDLTRLILAADEDILVCRPLEGNLKDDPTLGRWHLVIADDYLT